MRYATQAYETFVHYADLAGPGYLEEAVDENEFSPTQFWRSDFPEDWNCTHRHTLAFWAHDNVTHKLLPNGTIEFTGAPGQVIQMRHYPRSEYEWNVCTLAFSKAPPLDFVFNMPVALTAPYQIAFPGYELPGAAAAKKREQRKQQFIRIIQQLHKDAKRKADTEAAVDNKPKEARQVETDAIVTNAAHEVPCAEALAFAKEEEALQKNTVQKTEDEESNCSAAAVAAAEAGGVIFTE